MLKIPQLDDLGFERIFERARSGIASLTDEWTDYNQHDPGITTLHTFAWLADMLNYYIDATGEKHRLKYLKLLGLEPQAAPARCVLGFDAPQAEISIPRGTRVMAGSIPFETLADYRARRNRLVHLVAETDGERRDLTQLAGLDGSWARVFSRDPHQNSAVYFGFERTLGEDTRFYVEVYQGYRRNPFDARFALTDCAWDCWADGGWHPVDILEDGTCGFLRSGFISLLLPEPTTPLQQDGLPRAHYLRCRLLRGSYDVQPRIGSVWVNCVEAEQVSLPARLMPEVSDGGEYVDLNCYVRESDLVGIALREGESWRLCYLHAPQKEGRCVVEYAASPGRAVAHFLTPPVPGQEILVSVMERQFWEYAVLGHTDGRAGQRFAFPARGVLEMKIALVEGENPDEMQFTLWELCGDVQLASPDARVFSLDEENGEVVFGDSLHGLQPEGGKTAVVVHVKTSLLGDGNALKGQVSYLPDPVYPQGVKVENLDDAHGGSSPLSSEELVLKLEEHMMRPRRAVNAQDYAEIVMRTPGLAIELVNIVPMREYSRAVKIPERPNTVVAVVRPYSDEEEHPVLSEHYRRLIRENFEQYRLLTTDLLVAGARYAGVSVYGRIVLANRMKEARQEVERLIEENVDYRYTRTFGARIYYARLLSALEMLECVQSAGPLTFEVPGGAAVRSESGDIQAPPDTLLYLRGIQIDYV